MNWTSKILAVTASILLLLAGLVLATRSLQPPAPAPAPARVSKVSRPTPKWRQDLFRALADARTERRFVLVNFTGSDWCGWSLRLRREVFAKPEFTAYAATNLVLVEVDFPRDNRQSLQQRAANATVALQYGVTRVPALVLLDGDGQALGTWGFEDGGAGHYLAEFRKAIAGPEPVPDLSATKKTGSKAVGGVKVSRKSASKAVTTSNKLSPESSRQKQRSRA